MNQQDFLKELQASPCWERFIFYYADKYFWITIDSTEKEAYINGKFKEVDEVVQLAALVDWLDSEGVHIITNFNIKGWTVYITTYGGMTSYSSTRSDATRAGILKAVKLLEEQLKHKQDA